MLLPDLVANSPLTASVPHQPVPFATSRALVPAIVTAYCLLASRYLYAATQRMLADFRPVVRVNDTKYSHHTTLLLHVDRRILPLWSVHRQMSATRNKELSAVGARLRALYHELFYTVDRQVEGRDISDEVNTLTQFHGLIKATPVWPYASVRIVLQILAPLAVPVVTWVTQEYLVPLVLSWLQATD